MTLESRSPNHRNRSENITIRIVKDGSLKDGRLVAEKKKKNKKRLFSVVKGACVIITETSRFKGSKSRERAQSWTPIKRPGERSIGLRENRLKRLFCIYSEHLKRQSPLSTRAVSSLSIHYVSKGLWMFD